MLRRIAISSLALATMVIGPAQQAAAQTECQVTYDVRFYSDATHQVQVGYLTHDCTALYVLYTLHGTYTNFQTEEPDGTCYCGPIE